MSVAQTLVAPPLLICPRLVLRPLPRKKFSRRMDPPILFLSLSPPLDKGDIASNGRKREGGLRFHDWQLKVTKVSTRYLPITLDYLSFFFLFFFFFSLRFIIFRFLDFRSCFRSFLLKKKRKERKIMGVSSVERRLN